MLNKNEIDLNTISESGQTFSFGPDEINTNSSLDNAVIDNPKNTIEITVLPVGGLHFEVKSKICVERPLNCSRCGEGFESMFKEDVTEYLSLDTESEGEDQGFLVLESSKWLWGDFIRESIELETPYQTYKYGEKCLKSCKHYDNALEKGWITEAKPKPNAFQALEKLKNKLN